VDVVRIHSKVTSLWMNHLVHLVLITDIETILVLVVVYGLVVDTMEAFLILVSTTAILIPTQGLVFIDLVLLFLISGPQMFITIWIINDGQFEDEITVILIQCIVPNSLMNIWSFFKLPDTCPTVFSFFLEALGIFFEFYEEVTFEDISFSDPS